MQKLCCVRTRQHPLPVWSYNLSLTNLLISQPILNHFRWELYHTQEVYKWKARLNVHGGQQEHGVHYWDTYTPVVTWQTVRFFFILSLLLDWRSRQLDFIMAYPQAPAEMPLYLCLPQGYK